MNIRKIFGTALLGLGITLIAVTPAMAKSDNHPDDLPNGYHLKTDICHNVDHNPVVVPVSVDSADYPFDTGHGDLTLDEDHGFVSFVPHTETGGHEHDFVLRVYVKHGNDEVNTYVAESKCEVEEPTTTTTEPPVVTTTTEPPVVTTTTQPPTVVTQPPAVDTPTVPATDTPAPAPVVEQPAVPVSAPAPVDQLPHTGAGSLFLAAIGLGVLLTGAGLKFVTS